MQRRSQRNRIICVLGAIMVFSAAQSIQAAIFTVNTIMDSPDANPGDGLAADANGLTSLRAAIMEANAQPGGGPHTIRFANALAGSTLTLTLPGINEDNALTGDLDVRVGLTITGPAAPPSPAAITIHAQHLDRVFDVHDANFTIENLRLMEGVAPPTQNGGGIRFNGAARSLILTDVALHSNHADRGGALAFDGISATLTRVAVEFNSSIFDGAGIYFNSALAPNGSMTITQSQIVTNFAGNLFSPADGGGICTENGTTLTVVLSTIAGNQASERGGGVRIGGSATADLIDTLIQENLAALAGGVRSGGYTTMTCCRVEGNNANGPPLGAVPGTAGGGIYAFGNLTTLTDCTIDANGVSSGNPLDMGGGLLVSDIGTVVASGCTFSRNTVGQTMTQGYGGGVANLGRLTMSNCTLSTNLANNNGGGMYNFWAGNPAGNLMMSHVTIARNHAHNAGGGLYQDVLIPCSILATLIAENTVTDPATGMAVPRNFDQAPAAQPLNDQGYNLDSDGTCGFTHATSFVAPAGIASLTNNGGATETHAPVQFSPAIDKATLCTDLGGAVVWFDQRGVSRPIDGDGDGNPICDIGAFEYQPPTQPPFNDDCSAAGSIILSPGAFTFNTSGATTDGPFEPCGFSGVNDADVWMTVIAPCNGTATLELFSAFDRMLAVYSNCPAAGGTVIACSPGVGPAPASVTFSTVAGQVYIVRVGGVNGASGIATIDYDFQSCAGDIAPQPFGDCMVNVQDLLAVIAAWGSCPLPCPPTCAADVNHDCQVNVQDLIAVINVWGFCP